MLALHVQSMEANEKAVIAFSHSHLVDEKGQFLRDFKDDYGFIFGDTAKWAKDFTVHGKSEFAKYMVFSNTIPNASGILMRKWRKNVFHIYNVKQNFLKLHVQNISNNK